MAKCNNIFKYKENVGKDFLILFVVYLMSQWMLLLVSGYWWDDSVLIIKTQEERRLFYSMNGVVTGSFITDTIINFPHFFYRVVVFVIFFLSLCLVYLLLRNQNWLSDVECLYISCLFATTPVNDARATIICYIYSACWSLFILGWFLAITERKHRNYSKKNVFRVLSLAVLFVSYSTESMLVMTVILLASLYYEDFLQCINDNESRNNFKLLLKIVLKNVDYLLLPVVFWIIKTTFFKPWGIYEKRNVFSIGELINIIKILPVALWESYKNVIYNLINALNYRYLAMLFGLVALVICIFYVLKCRKEMDCYEHKYSKPKKDILCLILGMVIFSLGAFPYILVRHGDSVATIGVSGRDSLCLGIGFSISFYYLCKLLFREHIKNYILIIAICLGVVHFNKCYLQYQEEWYQELEFMNEVKDNDCIQDNNTFWVIRNYDTPCGSDRYYNMNVNSFLVTGEKTRFYANNLKYLTEWTGEFSTGHGVDEYDYTDMSIDGILIFDNYPLDVQDVAKLKCWELFDKNRFNDEIASYNRFEYIPITKDQSDMIIDNYENGMASEYELLESIL